MIIDRRFSFRNQADNAFTMIELLVVIGIVGVLIAILLPAVQAAREAARQVNCKNHLHQIGIALHSYHDVHRSLPTGCFEWRYFRAPPTLRQFAWSAFLLPFIEQQPLHERIDFGLPFDAPKNADAAATRVGTYECPTAPQRQLIRAQTDYAGIFGELLVDNEQDDGVFLYEKPIRFVDILDGLTNTLIIGEDVGGPDSEWINGRNVFAQAFGVNDIEAPPFDNEIRSLHGGGAMVLFADGRTVFLSESIDRTLLGRLITRAKREPVDTTNL